MANMIEIACGHVCGAIGSPDSPARKLQVANMCIGCAGARRVEVSYNDEELWQVTMVIGEHAVPAGAYRRKDEAEQLAKDLRYFAILNEGE